MTRVIGLGLVTLALSLLTAFVLAILCSLPQRRGKSWSSMLSGYQLWRLGIYTLSIWLWPFSAAAWSWGLAVWTPYPRPLIGLSTLAAASVAISSLIAVSRLRNRVRRTNNTRLSEETRKKLEPEILRRWTQVGGRLSDVRVEVRAFRTPSGTQGSVTVWVLSGERPNRDVADHLASVVPPHLKFRLEARRR